MNSTNYRAIQQRIYLNMNDYSEMIAQFYPNDLGSIKNDQKATVCSKLYDIMRLHQDLYYLKNVKPYDEELSKEIEMRITPCSESENDEKVKSNIQYQVNKNTKYKYPHQERMREVFG